MNSNDQLPSYGKLCSLFYDATKCYAPDVEVDFFSSFIPENGRVLEAMSGSGRLQIPLIQRGYIVDGVDNSKDMLARCYKRCEELNLKPEIYEQNLEDLNIPHRYTTITIAVASFQLIVDRNIALKILKNLRSHIVDGGSILIDIFTPNVNSDARSTRIAYIDKDTKIRLNTFYIFDEINKIADCYCHYDLIVDGITQEQEEELIRLTWYSDEELRQLLKEANFELITIYDKTFRSSGPSRVAHALAR